VEIETPNVAIRPDSGEGSYRILVNSDNETIIDVRKGSAEISTPQGSTRVERDQRITIQGNADNAQYQLSGAPGRDDWDRWNLDRDRNIESAQSWQHTNPYYTGSQDLDAYGHWSNVPDYGDVWFPSADAGWAPYRDGRWVFEPYYGWTWVSYEPWGWAPYHYGRWFVYGGNWGWWPGPVYGGYRPLWAPAYVSFFGFGGGGWGVDVGVGFGGGFGSIGWLPCGPGDRFFPWYGRGVSRVNVVNITNIHNNYYGGVGPLREGPHAYSNVDRAFNDQRVRGGISSMRSNEFGHGRVAMQQSRIDPGPLRQASMMTGAHPLAPTRESYQSTNRPVNPSSIPNRAAGNQRFFSGNNARANGSFQPGRSDGNFNRGGNPAGNNNANRGPAFEQNQRGFNQPPQQQQGRSVESSRPGWRTFTPPSRQPQGQPNGGRGYDGGNRPYDNGNRQFGNQPGAQARPNYPQAPEQSRQNQRQFQADPRGQYNGNNSGRPTLNMQQPVVRPRNENSNPGKAPNYGGYRGGPPTGNSYPGHSPNQGNFGGYQGGAPNGNPNPGRAPNEGNYGGYRGGPPNGGYSGRPTPSAPSGGYSSRPMPSAPPAPSGGYRGGAPSGGGGYRGGGGSPNGGSRGGNYGGGSHAGNNSSGGGHNDHR
jgi:hypothetical protein